MSRPDVVCLRVESLRNSGLSIRFKCSRSEVASLIKTHADICTGDLYRVTVDGQPVTVDRNGEIVGDLP